MIIITCWKLLMGLRDCSSPAPASRTFDVIVLTPPGTSSGVDALQPCEEWLSLAAISVVRLLHLGFTAMILHQRNESSLDIENEWRFWAAQLQVSKQHASTLNYDPALSPSTSPFEEWSMDSWNDDVWSALSLLSHLAHMQLHFHRRPFSATLRPLGDLMSLPLGTPAMSLMTSYMKFGLCGFWLTYVR